MCIQCFWEWLIQHLKKKPIIRYEQVPFDIDDHIEEEFVQETTRLLAPETDSDCDDDSCNEQKVSSEQNVSIFNEESVRVHPVSVELTSQSQMTITPYVTAESTDNDTSSSSEESKENSENNSDEQYGGHTYLTSDAESTTIDS